MPAILARMSRLLHRKGTEVLDISFHLDASGRVV
jgi:hypothetical protein